MRPISYYYATAFWASQFRDSFFSKCLSAIRAPVVWAGAAMLMAIMTVLVAIGRRRPGAGWDSAVAVAVMAAGCSGMAIQVVIILAFQAFCGYLFYRLGVIMTLFMVGLAVGSVLAGRSPGSGDREIGRLRAMQAALCVYPLALYASLALIAAGSIGRSFGDAVIFNIAPLAAGLIGGAHFAFAGRLLLFRGRGPAAAGSAAYGADLLGSCVGAALASAVLVPVIGAGGACLIIAATNLIALLLLSVAV